MVLFPGSATFPGALTFPTRSPHIYPNQIAMGIGSGGAMVEVSSYVEFGEGIDYSWGKENEFSSISPAKWSFVLDNHDGRFTPGNASSPLATTVTEGMTVSWLLGSRLVVGSILAISPMFPGSQSAWSQVKVTVDDSLGVAARTDISSLPDSINQAAGQYAFWSMDGDENTIFAAEATNTGLGSFAPSNVNGTTANPAVAFGQPAVPGFDTSQVALYAAAEINYFALTPTAIQTIPYPDTTIGGWGFWFTPRSNTQFAFQYGFGSFSSVIALEYVTVAGGGRFQLIPGTGTPVTITLPPTVSLYQPHYWAFTSSTVFAAGVWTITLSMYLDGVFIGSSAFASGPPITSLTTVQRKPASARFYIGDGTSTTSATIGRLSHTMSLAREELAIGTTEAVRLRALDACVPAMVLDSLPVDLSVQPIGFDKPNGSVLDAINDVIKTEQGYIWSFGSGTLLAPTQLVGVRSRQRPSAVSESFDAETELSDAPDFVRDITNMLASVTVSGTGTSATVTDGSVSGRVGSASGSDRVLNNFYGDVEAWAQDRLIRGENVNLRVQSVTVDAMSTPLDRSLDLLGLVPGDRVRITNLPSTQLGSTTWDGWLIGGDESHALGKHEFTLYFAPVLSQASALFDTARFGSDGSLFLVSSITSSATTMHVDTQGLETPSLVTPYVIQIDSEQMLVTAASGPLPDWTLTVTRGYNGTTAAAHTLLAPVNVSPVPRFVF